ncbi:MAG: DUF4395 family protein [Desulfobulbaceae bacterium]|jgi:hypothetical protein|nr:DUF4395 family protein [Desulfobulbaceae bacterium]
MAQAQFRLKTISKGSFAFCRIMIAGLLWLSIIFQIKYLVGVVFLIMLFSALLKVDKAPLILLYKYTVDRISPGEKIIVDEKGIYASHLAGTIFSVICLFLLYFANPTVAWGMTGLFTILQTSAACGFCSVLKLYNCMTDGNCCRVGRLAKKVKDNVGRS